MHTNVIEHVLHIQMLSLQRARTVRWKALEWDQGSVNFQYRYLIFHADFLQAMYLYQSLMR